MNCFQLVKKVLDELYESIPKDESCSKDDSIIKALNYLQDSYLGLTKGKTIKYNHPALRFAYIYRYVTSHVNLIYQITSLSTDLSELFEDEIINVTCLGGGPGSDILGIIKHCLLARVEPIINCTMMDRMTSWEKCWEVFTRNIQPQLQVNYQFQAFDIIDARTWIGSPHYLKSDIFTMSYFLSELDSFKVESEPFFTNLFRKAKHGALFLYVDNNSPQFYNWFDSLVNANHVTILRSDESKMRIMDTDEEKKDLGEYFEKFSSPQLNPNIAFRICRKN